MKVRQQIDLDEAQRSVVERDGGPLLVLGGPGSGKTHTLEQRYLRLAGTGDLAPHRILMLCVNRRYSQDAKDRLVWALPQRATIEVPVYTWHALAYHLVSRYYPHLKYREAPVLLTGPEQWGVVRHLMTQDRTSDWPHWRERLGERAFVDEVADFCLRVQQRRMPAEELQAIAETRVDWAEVVAFYGRYQRYLKDESRLDYAGLINAAADLLTEDEGVRETLHARFPHILVDDAQEMSPSQLGLLESFDTSRLVAAADPDSGIEAFRGAEPDWVAGFEGRFGGSRTHLPRTYRLGEEFLAGALHLIEDNDPQAAHRPLEAASHDTSADARAYSSISEEADAIAAELRRLHLEEQTPFEEMAVLVSQPHQLLGPLEDALRRREVPFESASGDRPVSTEPAVAAFLDLLRIASRTEGWEEKVPQVLTSPLIGMGFADRRRLERQAWQQGRSFFDVVEESEETDEFRRLRDLASRHLDRVDECFWEVYQQSRYYQGLVEAARKDPSSDASGVLDSLVAFTHALGRFVERRHGRGSVAEYLTEAARADFGGDPWLARPEEGGRVTLTTYHASRGREWDVVVVAGCLDAWIPKGRRAQGLFDPFALETPDLTGREVEALAEDRRTFYVAATRARARVRFTVAPGAGGKGQPSRFLTDLFGSPPPEAEPEPIAPLTFAEMRASLRRTLDDAQTSGAEKLAAAVALSETPGVDPSRWYGRWDWTEGAVPLIEDEFATSYSRLGTYENCGLQYLLQSVLGLDETSTHSMKFGTWMHALFEALGRQEITNRRDLDAAYDGLFDPAVFPSASVARNYRRYGEKILETFLKHEMGRFPVEVEFGFKDFRVGRARFRGRIDRIDRIGNNLTLTDYKTSRSAATAQEAADSLQLAIYTAVAKEHPKLKELGEPATARLVYPGATFASGDPIVRCQSPDEAKEVIEVRLPQIIDSVLEEDFRPSPEAECRWCQMKPLCPLWHGDEVTR